MIRWRSGGPRTPGKRELNSHAPTNPERSARYTVDNANRSLVDDFSTWRSAPRPAPVSQTGLTGNQAKSSHNEELTLSFQGIRRLGSKRGAR